MPQDLPVPLAPSFLTAISSFRRDCLASLASTHLDFIMVRYLKSTLVHYSYQIGAEVIPALSPSFSFCKRVLTVAVNSANASNNFATGSHHARLPPRLCCGALLVPNRCKLSQRCLLHFPSAKWVLTSAVNSANISNNSVTITEYNL